MKHEYPISPQNQSNSRWNGNIQPLPSRSKRKIMATVFWDQCGVFLVDFMPQGTTINSSAYCATLWKLRRALRNKRHGMLSKRVLVLHDNAGPHTSRTIREWKDHSTILPVHRWYRGKRLRGSLSLQCSKQEQSVVTRFGSGHLRTLTYNNKEKQFPACARADAKFKIVSQGPGLPSPGNFAESLLLEWSSKASPHFVGSLEHRQHR
ncbi:HTH_48 domain-containing protein [Trichonephila clavipes]|nr:HTH_48 domain-containing protein [Trichonephila clavipes]